MQAGGEPRFERVSAGQHHDEAALIEAVRRDPPDAAALQLLVDRHWRALVARCRLLTGSGDDARDLAQESWCRLLRSRHLLRPDGDLGGYLVTIATNLWRDDRRSRRRAGAIAPERLLSLDAPVAGTDDGASLGASVPSPRSEGAEQLAALRIDIDRALASLAPRHREVLLARYLDGESAAEIGRRFGRSEQTITSWIRQATAVLRHTLAPDGTGSAASSGAVHGASHSAARIAASGADAAGGDAGARA